MRRHEHTSSFFIGPLALQRSISFPLSGLVLVVLLGFARPASAVAPVEDCAHPSVFPQAAINFVVLPYTDSVSREKPLSRTASDLTLMVQTNTIFSILKYGSVGSIRLVVRPGQQAECQPAIVAAKLLGETPGARETIRPGHGLILLWGRLYEENNEIYLQSFTRFLRKGITENLSLSLWDTHYEARLLDEAVAFAPQRLTPSDRSDIEREFQQFAVVHQAPQDNSPGAHMPVDLSSFQNSNFVYTVEEVRNDWMRIQAYGPGPSGWIHAGADAGPLRAEHMPELNFVDGVAGYLRFRGAVEGDTPDTSLQTVSWAEDALRKYEEAGDPKRAPLALAVAKTVHGLLETLGPVEAQSKTKTALKLFQDASDLVPYSGETRNLELTTRWYLAYHVGWPGLKPGVVADGFLQAAVLAPDNPTILKNLENCYELLLEKGPPPGASTSDGFDRTELQKRLIALRLVQSSSNP